MINVVFVVDAGLRIAAADAKPSAAVVAVLFYSVLSTASLIVVLAVYFGDRAGAEARLATMRPDSILVNTARSALIDMAALEQALEAGRPGIAALDVYDDEPVPADHPLLKRANVVLSPHLGFVNDPVFAKFGPGVVENLMNWLEGRPLVRLQSG